MIKRQSMQYVADIRTALLQKADRVFFLNAPEQNRVYPYAVFDVRALTDMRQVIEVDLWGKKGGEVALQNLADNLEAYLDGYIINNDYHTSLFTTNNDMKWVADDDERLIRINLSFNATYQA